MAEHYGLAIKSNKIVCYHQTPRIQKSGIGVRGI